MEDVEHCFADGVDGSHFVGRGNHAEEQEVDICVSWRSRLSF